MYKYLIVLFSVFIFGCSTSSQCTTKTIIDVGGCATNAKCGVLYDDGTFGKEFYPVKLQKVKVCD